MVTSQEMPGVAGGPSYTVQSSAANCPQYFSNPNVWYCHDVEDENNLFDTGLFASMGQYAPTVQSGDSGHSIAQLWAEDGSGSSLATLETGWKVDPAVFGNGSPHLFEYHTGTDYGAGGCYDACGFVGAGGSPVTLGETLPTNGSVAKFGVELDQSDNWWIYYGGYWVGYIPESDPSWQGNALYAITNAEVGGEVASTIGACPYTQMGDGAYGSQGGSGLISSAVLWKGSNDSYLVPTGYLEEGENLYNIGAENPSQGGFQYGGPGCP